MRTITQWRKTPLPIILIYVIISGIWIVFSDRLLAIVETNPENYLRDQTFKGWFFVAITAVLLYGMIQRHTQTLRLAQEKAQESEAWYRRLITTAKEGIWILDPEYRTTFVNQRMSEMVGYTVEEMLGRFIFDFTDVSLRGEILRHLEMRISGSSEAYGTPFIRKDGSELWVLSSVTPTFDTQGKYTGSFVMLTDITERHSYIEFQREFARKTIEAATEGKLLIRDREEILRIAGVPIFSLAITHADGLEQARHAVSEAALAAGMDEERVFDYTLCISEAATNAVKHAGVGILSLHRIDESLLVVIADSGPGIPAINLPEVALKPGYSTAVSLGMGYKAMISIADKVYLATDPNGTTVAIEMAIHAIELPQVVIPPQITDTW